MGVSEQSQNIHALSDSLLQDAYRPPGDQRMAVRNPADTTFSKVDMPTMRHTDPVQHQLAALEMGPWTSHYSSWDSALWSGECPPGGTPCGTVLQPIPFLHPGLHLLSAGAFRNHVLLPREGCASMWPSGPGAGQNLHHRDNTLASSPIHTAPELQHSMALCPGQETAQVKRKSQGEAMVLSSATLMAYTQECRVNPGTSPG